jgi:hypothetical protein
MIQVHPFRARFFASRRRCEDCCRITEVEWDNDTWINTDCPICGRSYDSLSPIWYSILNVENSRPIHVFGPQMDSIMGMTIESYLSLCQHFGDLSDLVVKYLTANTFLLSQNVDRVLTISLTPGCQLTFVRWLGLQPGFDRNEIEVMLLDTSIEDWEETEIFPQESVGGIEKTDLGFEYL